MATTMEQYEAEIAPLKRQLFSAAVVPGNEVLELGMGTGPNLKYYAQQASCLCIACTAYVLDLSRGEPFTV